MEEYLVGIDFGTCSIKVSNWDSRQNRVNRMKIDKNENNPDKKVPNVIEYKKNSETNLVEVVVGEKARKSQNINYENVVEQIKRKLELESWIKDFPSLGVSRTAVEIATDIFSWIKNNIEQQGKNISKSVITVPVCFTEVQKARIQKSAVDAGLSIEDMITEPVAALFSIDELFENECEETVLIFDFGGATLDLSLFQVENDGDGNVDIQVLASNGIDFGGVDITEGIYSNIFYNAYKQLIDEEISKDKLNRTKKELLDLVDKMKSELFEDDEEEVEDYYSFPSGTKMEPDPVLKLADVEQYFDKIEIKQKIIKLLDDLIDQASTINKEDITMVKMFGGTSRVLYFREIIAEYFEEDIFDIDDYNSDEAYSAVSNGAARYLGIISDGDSKIEITNAIPFCVGINNNGKFKPVIQKNEKYGFKTKNIPLHRNELESNGWKVPLYQSFADSEDISINGEDGAVYMGCYHLDALKYDAIKTILYSVRVDTKGKLIGRFSKTDAENNIIPVENIELIIGG